MDEKRLVDLPVETVRPEVTDGPAAVGGQSAAEAHGEEQPSTAELEDLLDGIALPATDDEVIGYAEAHGAGEAMLSRLRKIERGRYDTLHAVSAAFTLEGTTSTLYGRVTVYDQ
ncbi:MAG: hypothetical protein JWP95_2030 [Actinotalea sp.]|nr:hypothetical protein [Actinotalea sp.]